MKKLTPVLAIRKFCIKCSGDNQKAPKLCTSLNCELFDYRNGKNPARQGIGGRQGGKRNGEGICASRVTEKRQEIIVRGNKRIVIEDIE